MLRPQLCSWNPGMYTWTPLKFTSPKQISAGLNYYIFAIMNHKVYQAVWNLWNPYGGPALIAGEVVANGEIFTSSKYRWHITQVLLVSWTCVTDHVHLESPESINRFQYLLRRVVVSIVKSNCILVSDTTVLEFDTKIRSIKNSLKMSQLQSWCEWRNGSRYGAR